MPKITCAMAAKIKSQPNNRATPIENVRGSTIARIPQANTTTAEAINQRVARLTSMLVSTSGEFFTTHEFCPQECRWNRIFDLTVPVEMIGHLRVHPRAHAKEF